MLNTARPFSKTVNWHPEIIREREKVQKDGSVLSQKPAGPEAVSAASGTASLPVSCK